MRFPTSSFICKFLIFNLLVVNISLQGGDKDPSEWLGQPKGKILTLGVFHFQNTNLDTHKSKNHPDMMLPKRQEEIAEVVDLLASFKPTKVAIEWRETESGEKTRKDYQAYLEGKFELTVNEVYQLGFRLAKKAGLPTVHLVDALGRDLDNPIDPEAYLKKHPDQARYLTDEWQKRYEAWWDYRDLDSTKSTLREHLLLINDEAQVVRNHGVYLTDSFAAGVGNDYLRVDGFISKWYNRNLRIFANMMRITEKPDERIVLIIGAGHLGILHHLVNASPEYALVPVAEFLAPGKN